MAASAWRPRRWRLRGGALRRANQKFERRFRMMEVLAAAEGIVLAALPLDEQDAYWNQAKAGEAK